MNPTTKIDELRSATLELYEAAVVACTFDCSRHGGPPQQRDLGCNICHAFSRLERATRAVGMALGKDR
jgi:hypothetical protein